MRCENRSGNESASYDEPRAQIVPAGVMLSPGQRSFAISDAGRGAGA